MDESVRESIKKAIDDQLSISMISDGMQGGWQMEHVHQIGNHEDAPDKGITGSVLQINPEEEEKK